ncbi:piggyBac transposable element-derived protein 4-like [Uloborus diversus]|uniref:piggyBac transposable element-derived protein 4-like n=1 Tax=Uloborus diversus TaxID=327109 RepID=UPI002409ABCB|nr:piggyBac transposable element-derived protein 4-like [Uloborus diversus]
MAKMGEGVLQGVFCGIFKACARDVVSSILLAMAKRPRYLTESEISKIMNESDSETSKDSDCDIGNYSGSEGSSSSETEGYDYDEEVAGDACSEPATNWSSEIKQIPEIDFSVRTGPNFTTAQPVTELDCFNLFFDERLLDIIVNETNAFAQKIIEKKQSESEPSTSCLIKPFQNITVDELMIFLSLVILMSIIRKPNLKMYFSTNTMLLTPFFSMAMARNRFLDILRFLHFNSDAEAKKLEKIKPVLTALIENFKSILTPERNICIDETLFGWKGRLSFRQYIPSKRARYGIKIYKLCESQTGYIWNCCVYTGKDTGIIQTAGLYGERVVKTLLSDLLGKGYNLYLDRFFVSPNLASYLHENNTNMCGTVMRNRKGMPKIIPDDKKKTVLMLSTAHDNVIVSVGKKDRKTGEDISKPLCVVEYNQNMGGVDCGDSVIHHYPAFRKTVKWYKKLFFGFLDVALLNANIIYSKVKGEKLSALEFRTRIVHQITDKFSKPKTHKIAPKSPDTQPFRLSGRHFPKIYIDGKGKLGLTAQSAWARGDVPLRSVRSRVSDQ